MQNTSTQNQKQVEQAPLIAGHGQPAPQPHYGGYQQQYQQQPAQHYQPPQSYYHQQMPPRKSPSKAPLIVGFSFLGCVCLLCLVLVGGCFSLCVVAVIGIKNLIENAAGCFNPHQTLTMSTHRLARDLSTYQTLKVRSFDNVVFKLNTTVPANRMWLKIKRYSPYEKKLGSFKTSLSDSNGVLSLTGSSSMPFCSYMHVEIHVPSFTLPELNVDIEARGEIDVGRFGKTATDRSFKSLKLESGGSSYVYGGQIEGNVNINAKSGNIRMYDYMVAGNAVLKSKLNIKTQDSNIQGYLGSTSTIGHITLQGVHLIDALSHGSQISTVSDKVLLSNVKMDGEVIVSAGSSGITVQGSQTTVSKKLQMTADNDITVNATGYRGKFKIYTNTGSLVVQGPQVVYTKNTFKAKEGQIGGSSVPDSLIQATSSAGTVTLNA